ncbi:EamA family transporter [Capnocytophaga gingivalis]|uniref:EamA family transporter n=1 Tax=Capnocytophaga gingivalis TaxID=1017 RepID=UPI00288BC5D5|nr:EamA family transporter [Capnocytophaga gingivalis]
MNYLGTVHTSTYIYGMPITTLIASVLILGEPISFMAIIGTLMVLIGVYFATRK